MTHHPIPATKELSPEEKKEKRYDRFGVACMIGLVVCWYGFQGDEIKFQRLYIPWIVFIGGAVLGLVPIYWIRRYVFSMDVTPRTFFSDFAANVKNIFLSIVVFGFLAKWGFHQSIERKVAGQPEMVATVPVESIHFRDGSSRSHNSVSFWLDGHLLSVSDFFETKEMRQKAEPNQKASLVLHYKIGPWTSYVIDDWDFVPGTANQ